MSQSNLEADWVEVDAGAILRHCPLCQRESITTGSRSVEVSAIGAARRSPFYRCSLRPTATTVWWPGVRRYGASLEKAAAGNGGAHGKRSAPSGRPVHPAPLVSKPGLLSATVFILGPAMQTVHQALDEGKLVHHDCSRLRWDCLRLSWQTVFACFCRFWPLRL